MNCTTCHAPLPDGWDGRDAAHPDDGTRLCPSCAEEERWQLYYRHTPADRHADWPNAGGDPWLRRLVIDALTRD